MAGPKVGRVVGVTAAETAVEEVLAAAERVAAERVAVGQCPTCV